MKIAITGASGHVGANLCRMLTGLGHEVKALIHNSSRGLEDLDLECIHGDVTNEADLRRLCQGCETVFHLAAFISIRQKDSRCDDVNTLSCTRLLSAARAEGVRRIIHFSSIHAFSLLPLDGVLDEGRPWPSQGMHPTTGQRHTDTKS
jgi:dihydroflavonol-4-reductase